jgi:hypothetical protein
MIFVEKTTTVLEKEAFHAPVGRQPIGGMIHSLDPLRLCRAQYSRKRMSDLTSQSSGFIVE